MAKKRYVTLCPICGSSNVSNNFSTEAVATGFSSFIYRCNDCGFVAQAFPEVEESRVEEARKKIKKMLDKS